MAASSYRETPVTGSVEEEATEPGSKGRGLSLATQQALKVKMLDYAAKEQLGAPVRLQGEVVKGFGRGSKELGVPTANLPVETLGAELDGLNPGVYYGWASVDGEVPCKMVMSIGWSVRGCSCLSSISASIDLSLCAGTPFMATRQRLL